MIREIFIDVNCGGPCFLTVVVLARFGVVRLKCLWFFLK